MVVVGYVLCALLSIAASASASLQQVPIKALGPRWPTIPAAHRFDPGRIKHAATKRHRIEHANVRRASGPVSSVNALDASTLSGLLSTLQGINSTVAGTTVLNAATRATTLTTQLTSVVSQLKVAIDSANSIRSQPTPSGSAGSTCDVQNNGILTGLLSLIVNIEYTLNNVNSLVTQIPSLKPLLGDVLNNVNINLGLYINVLDLIFICLKVSLVQGTMVALGYVFVAFLSFSSFLPFSSCLGVTSSSTYKGSWTKMAHNSCRPSSQSYTSSSRCNETKRRLNSVRRASGPVSQINTLDSNTLSDLLSTLGNINTTVAATTPLNYATKAVVLVTQLTSVVSQRNIAINSANAIRLQPAPSGGSGATCDVLSNGLLTGLLNLIVDSEYTLNAVEALLPKIPLLKPLLSDVLSLVNVNVGLYINVLDVIFICLKVSLVQGLLNVGLASLVAFIA
ncbi:hypothetical protein P7C70_g385, partial [Phenoliferia sp. Uapishka_3]